MEMEMEMKLFGFMFWVFLVGGSVGLTIGMLIPLRIK